MKGERKVLREILPECRAIFGGRWTATEAVERVGTDDLTLACLFSPFPPERAFSAAQYREVDAVEVLTAELESAVGDRVETLRALLRRAGG